MTKSPGHGWTHCSQPSSIVPPRTAATTTWRPQLRCRTGIAAAAVGKARRGFLRKHACEARIPDLAWRFALGITKEPAARLPYLALTRDEHRPAAPSLKKHSCYYTVFRLRIAMTPRDPSASRLGRFAQDDGDLRRAITASKAKPAFSPRRRTTCTGDHALRALCEVARGNTNNEFDSPPLPHRPAP
jgi:hypothetical protein